MNFILWLVLGTISGWLAGKVMKSRFGLLGDIVIGIIGGFIGGFLFGLIGISTGGLIGSLITSVIGAFILLFVINLVRRGIGAIAPQNVPPKRVDSHVRLSSFPKNSSITNQNVINQPTVTDTGIDIFLSYSRRDTDLMRRLYQDLRAEGFSVWIDETNLEPGTPSWQRAVEEAIQAARCIVVILSPEAKQSRWVEIEVTIAEENGIRIIPILARGDPKNAVLFRLTPTQRIDMRNDYQTGLKGQLIPALQRYLKN